MAGLSCCPRVVQSKNVVDTRCPAAARLSQKQANVATGASMQLRQSSSVQSPISRRAVVDVVAFKFMKKLGVKKPGFLPDFGKVCSAIPAIILTDWSKVQLIPRLLTALQPDPVLIGHLVCRTNV